MKNKKILALLLACTIMASGVPVYAADFSDGTAESVQDAESSLFGMEDSELTEDTVPAFADTEENADAAQITDGNNEEEDLTGDKTEDPAEDKGTEGLEYEYVPEIDGYRVKKGVNEKEIRIPEKYEGKEVLEIGEGAFAGDDKIQKVQFNGVLNHITIRKNAFEGCVNLIMVLTDSGIFNIESNAFKNCPKLIRLGNYYMPDQVEKGGVIADDAFDSDSRVVVTGLGMLPHRENGYPFYNTDIEEPENLSGEDGMTYLQWGEYQGIDKEHAGYRIISCTEEKETVKVTENIADITGVGRKAFYGNEKIRVLDLGKNIKYIETKAFFNCKNLQRIYIPSTTKEIAEDAFEGCDSLTIYASKGSYAAQYARKHKIPVVYESSQDVMKNVKMKFKVERESKYSSVIQFKWNKVDFAEGYQIQVKDSKTGKFRTQKTIKDGDTCKYAIVRQGHQGQENIVFRIRAYCKGADNKNIYSQYKTASMKLWPAQPKIYSIEKKSKGRAHIKWKKVSGVSGYQVLRSESGKKFKCIKTIKNSNTVEYTDTGLKKGIQYSYEICSYKIDSDGKKIYSEDNYVRSFEY